MDYTNGPILTLGKLLPSTIMLSLHCRGGVHCPLVMQKVIHTVTRDCISCKEFSLCFSFGSKTSCLHSNMTSAVPWPSYCSSVLAIKAVRLLQPGSQVNSLTAPTHRTAMVFLWRVYTKGRRKGTRYSGPLMYFAVTWATHRNQWPF